MKARLTRIIAFMMLIALLTQSCAVYQDASVPIDEAVDMGKVLLITNDGYRYEYKKIVKKDSIYYGYDSHPSAIIDALPIRAQIDTTEIYSIQLMDKKKTNKKQFLWTAGLLVLGGVAAVLLYYSLMNNW